MLYKVEVFAARDLEEQLNVMAREGWRLCSTQFEMGRWTCIFEQNINLGRIEKVLVDAPAKKSRKLVTSEPVEHAS